MVVPLVFWLLLLGALSIGWHAGDRQDRRIILIIGLATILTTIAQLTLEFLPSRIAICAIDLALLVLVFRYALQANRHWPIWFAGIQATATLLDAIAIVLPQGDRSLFSVFGGFWAIPALLILAIGLLADQRNGVSNANQA